MKAIFFRTDKNKQIPVYPLYPCELKEIKRQPCRQNLDSGAVVGNCRKITNSRVCVGIADERLHSDFSEFAFFFSKIVSKLNIKICVFVVIRSGSVTCNRIGKITSKSRSFERLPVYSKG